MYLPVITNKYVTILNPFTCSRDLLHRPLEKQTSQSSVFLKVDTPPVELVPERKNDNTLAGFSHD